MSREWYLHPNGNEHGTYFFNVAGPEPKIIGKKFEQAVHVIEYSAYEKSQEQLKIAEDSIRGAYDYMKNFSCEETCTPLEGFHIPECCIVKDFEKALAEIERLRSEK